MKISIWTKISIEQFYGNISANFYINVNIDNKQKIMKMYIEIWNFFNKLDKKDKTMNNTSKTSFFFLENNIYKIKLVTLFDYIMCAITNVTLK